MLLLAQPPLLLAGLASLATLAAAAPTKRASTTDGSAVSGQTYDYVIAGGGLTGVVLARRLADAQHSVLMIEAGGDEEGNDLVTDASKYTQSFDSGIDWAFDTTPQAQGGGKSTKIRAGKGLGGSTLINGLAWTKPHTFQLDDLETLGNAGVNWDTLAPLMSSVEAWKEPSSAQLAAGLTSSAQCHGTGGPIGVAVNPAVPAAFERTFNATGASFLPYAADLTCGNPAGLGPVAHNSVGNRRQDAYYGYLHNKDVPKLTILTRAVVGKLTLDTSGATPRATGVEFRDQAGNTYTAKAGKEVLLAAGAIKTPLILQHSGIGPKAFLDAAGVSVVADLPAGQNLIDQTLSTTSFQHTSQAAGGGQSILFPRFSDMFKGADAERLKGLLQRDLGKWAQDAADAGATGSAAGLEKVLTLQRDWILNDGAAVAEAFDWTGGGSVNYDAWFLLPFARGFVKATSADPYASSFELDPRFFSNEFDRLATAGTLRFTRTFSRTPPLADIIGAEWKPGSGTGDDLESWLQFAVGDYRSNWHPIGTAAMLPKEDGGVVDANHKVYGVSGLRVVDASVLPFQVSSHLMSVLYALAERVAEKVKADASNQC